MFSHTQKMHTNTCGVANHTLMMQDMVRATPFPGKFSQFCPINHHLPLKNRLGNPNNRLMGMIIIDVACHCLGGLRILLIFALWYEPRKNSSN